MCALHTRRNESELMTGIGLIGYGYWGPNLARNFASHLDCTLVGICEINNERAALAARTYKDVFITLDYNELLKQHDIDVIVIATHVSSHYTLAREALLSGKDVLVEKPLSISSAEARELVQLAEEHERILAVDHTFLFTGAVRKMKEIIASGELGDIIYIDSVRINLGIFQRDVNVIYDLAPHDLSIVSYLIDQEPVAVQAVGSCHADHDIENLAYIHLEYPHGLMAHLHLNWLAPVKIRRTIICGSRKMIVYDDMERSEKIKIYDKGIVIKEGDFNAIYKLYVDYRTGDMVAPKLDHKEALLAEVEQFLACVQDRTRPLSDGRFGLLVTRILEAAQISIKNRGRRVTLEELL
jgi:predicted dehydrogenase